MDVDLSWTETIRQNPLVFTRDALIDALIAAVLFAVLLFLLRIWARRAHRVIEERDLWDDEQRENERQRINLLTRYLKNASVVISALLFVGLLGLSYQIPIAEPIALAVRDWLQAGGLGTIVRIIVVGGICMVILTVVRKAAQAFTPTSGQRFVRQVARAATIRSVVESSVQIAVGSLFVLYVLSELGANVSTLLAGVGILGLAISFGAQSLVKDFISGFFILFEDQFGVGDVVTVAGLSGGVEELNLRITTLRDLEGKVHIIPNGQITTVSVMSRDWARSVIDVEVAYKTDLSYAISVLEEEASAFAKDSQWAWRLIGPPEVLGVDEFKDSGIRLRLLFKTLPKEQWGIGREFRKRIKARFDTEGIEIPFPHMTVYWGDKQMPEFNLPDYNPVTARPDTDKLDAPDARPTPKDPPKERN